MNRAADDFETIALTLAYERGMRAAVDEAVRVCPDDCKATTSWFAGYDEGKRLLAAG